MNYCRMDEEEVDTEQEERASERDRARLLDFLEDLKPVHGFKLKEFAAGQDFTDNQLSQVRAGKQVRLWLFRAIEKRAVELQLPFPEVARKPLEQLIIEGLGLVPADLEEVGQRWGGDYLLFTRRPDESIGVASFLIAEGVNTYGLPYFRIWRRDTADALLVRGYCFDVSGGLYLFGHGYLPISPRFMALRPENARDRDLLVGGSSTSLDAELIYSSPCVALKVTEETEAEHLAPDIYELAVIAERYPAIASYLDSEKMRPLSILRGAGSKAG